MRELTTWWQTIAAVMLTGAFVGCSALDQSDEWPIHTAVGQPGGRHALLIVAEPEGSCTREAITTLTQLMRDTDARPRVFVLFARPAGLGYTERTDLWWTADAIEGVQVVDDPGGIEAAKFDAAANTVVRYTPRGKLVSTATLGCANGEVPAIDEVRTAFIDSDDLAVGALVTRIVDWVAAI